MTVATPSSILGSSQLADAIADSVAAGLCELDDLQAMVAEAGAAFEAATERLVDSDLDEHADKRAEESNAFAVLMAGAASELQQRMAASREVVSTFNIVFFGRTGAGKSTLMSALGGLDGGRVSHGESDWTTKIEAIPWNGCLLYDTPGTGGWGRTQSRASLEAEARRAVELADVVILCFDDQGQQQPEFALVAEWVQAYGKPAIAVFNNRIDRWRHPANERDQESRRALSETVRQHVDNINGELARIGLRGAPVVAMHSHRALMARAQQPYVGPSPRTVQGNLDRYGATYLDTWSNLRVLEDLIANCLVIGGTDLRLAALREGARTALLEWSAAMQTFADIARERAEVSERSVEQMLEVLGYPDKKARKRRLQGGAESDLLTALERRRGVPFDAPVTGRLAAHGRHLLRSHLGPARKKSLRRAEDAVIEAFESKKNLSDKKFERLVFDQDAVATALEDVAGKVDTFLTTQLRLTGLDGVADLRILDDRGVQVEGKAGSRLRATSTVLKATNVLAGGTGAVLAAIATTNFWNPAGWTAAAILGGLSVVSALTSWLGGKARRKAEKQRVRARAKAIGDARRAVASQFDLWETEQLAAFVDGAWRAASPTLRGLIQRSLDDRTGIREIEVLAASLASQAAEVPHAPRPETVIAQAVDLVVAASPDPDATENDVLLGEAWIRADATDIAPIHLSKKERSAFKRREDRDRARLRELLTDMARGSKPAQARAWLDLVASSGIEVEPGPTRPPLVLVGDFSSSKTSLVKRLLAETGQPVPDSLVVRGGPETSVASEHSLGPFDLIDTPGFQSGRENHDKAAVRAAREAAVLVVVLNINLLIGDTAMLAELLRGSARIAGKRSRCLFVIGRVDGLGVDPEADPRDFLNRCRRKEAELVSALAAHGIDVRPDQVYSVAADPFGLVGDRTDITAASYRARHPAWDGVRPLLDPLLAVGEGAAERLALYAEMDLAVAAIRTVREQRRAERLTAEAEMTATASLDGSIATAQAELDQLRRSIEARAQLMIDEHADDLIGEALGAGAAEAHGLAENLAEWWKDPRLDDALIGFEAEVKREIDEWFENNRSQIERRIDRITFAASAQGFRTAEQPPGGAGDAGNPTSTVLHESSRFAGILGHRDVIYPIGKFFNVKFKPWGAWRAGARVARAGAVLGVVATAFDIHSWVRDSQRESARETARRSAVDYIRATAPEIVEHILSGEERNGPVPYLADQSETLATMRADLADGRRQSEEIVERVTAHLEVCESLLDTVAQFDSHYTEETA